MPAAYAARQEAINPDAELVTPVWLPTGVANPTINVIVQLRGDPVALRQESAGRRLGAAEKDQIKAGLKAAQSALHGSIQNLGGTVLAEYQVAYNGIKVRIARDKISQLAALPGVTAVRPVQIFNHSNVRGVPLIGAPTAWQNLGVHGEGIKVAIIDTGIDYTHANFGGPGTTAAYDAAHAAETSPADPALFGPGAARIKGGIDLVGDSYNANPSSASYQPIPHPDPNPLDCNGHGSHVAGTAAGSGVLATGLVYTGVYDASTISGNSWTIGPGVAPKADLYAVRVFGCAGSTDVVVDAIEWAVDNDMDVINMSLGSPFGTSDTPDAEATTNAARAGVVVVTSAGNEGPSQYIAGSPGSADGAIAVAAIDPTPSFPGATLQLSTGPTIPVQNSNNATFANGSIWGVAVLRTSYPSGPVSLGCNYPADYAGYPGGLAALAGKLIVTTRGTCARVARAIFAQQAGGAASAMIDSTTGYPPFEGPITSNPDTGIPYTVTIPFFGVRGLPTGSTSDGAKLRNADGGTAIATNVLLPNPAFEAFASFSSSGPRFGDSVLKPQLSAPGVAIVSTGSGTGNGAATISGTSMASPHVAGVAALTRQAHPTWRVPAIMSAMVNTGDPAQVTNYRTSRGGTGLVQPAKSTLGQVTAQGNGGQFATALNFGIREIDADFSDVRTLALTNRGATNSTFNVAVVRKAGSPHSATTDKSVVTVPAGGSAQVVLSLDVPVATVGASNGAGLSYREVAGIVELTPATGADNDGVTLRVPYLMVPRSLSKVMTKLPNLKGTNPSAVATVTNNGAIPGDADFYAWGLEGTKTQGSTGADVRAIGVQAFPLTATSQLMVFAVNSFDRWSNASGTEFDIYVDVDGDGVDDYIIVGADAGAITTGTFNGVLGTFVFSTRSGGASQSGFGTVAPTDSSTALLPVRSSQLCRAGEPCLSAANPRITYHAVAFDLLNGGGELVPGSAKFNAFNPSISTGGFATVAPGGSDTSNVISVNSAEWAITPAKGVMVVTLDNKSGQFEAQLVPVSPK